MDSAANSLSPDQDSLRDGDVTHLPDSGERSARILPIAIPVIAAGTVVLAAACWQLAYSTPSPEMLAGLAALLFASFFAEAFPVPLDQGGSVTLTAVFIVGAAVLYGWEAAAIVAFLTCAVVELVQRKPLVRLAYNSSVYALGGVAAGQAAHAVPHRDAVEILLVETLLAATAFFCVNIVLSTAVIARWTGRPMTNLLAQNIVDNAAPFAIMASVSLMLAVLWQASPLLIAALVGPLVAVALYQRSVHKAMRAMRLALTDPQTGLGNKRHFEELLQRALDRADEERTPVTLLLADLDDFKTINDTYGHVAGDRVLAQVAARLRRGGESFRLGGDEFAVLLPGRTAAEGLEIAESVSRRIHEARYDHGGGVSVSFGVATYPGEGVERTDLVRVADRALYAAKGSGKASVHVYAPAGMPEAPVLSSPVAGTVAGLHAAASGARAAVARDVYIGEHSQNVGEFAARMAVRLGIDREQVELIRVAGSLHDIGKLLVPEEILYKPGPLTTVERCVVQRHSEIGHTMLKSLGLEPIATWVLHHHERWDGDGYPQGLAGEEIPLPSRILFVADAFDAMTSARVYRSQLTRSEGMAEVERCSGSQFDPMVVEALRAELASETPLELVLPASA
jgi:diguanylate cyclase (GGDEF)-like protein/putative nucleotidyltransferase with HDIG domain